MSILKVRFAVVFIEDGLDKDAIREDLKSRANLVDESAGSIQSVDGNEVPIWAYLMEGSIVQYGLVKHAYNAEEGDKYVLFAREKGETRSIFV